MYLIIYVKIYIYLFNLFKNKNINGQIENES